MRLSILATASIMVLLAPLQSIAATIQVSETGPGCGKPMNGGICTGTILSIDIMNGDIKEHNSNNPVPSYQFFRLSRPFAYLACDVSGSLGCPRLSYVCRNESEARSMIQRLVGASIRRSSAPVNTRESLDFRCVKPGYYGWFDISYDMATTPPTPPPVTCSATAANIYLTGTTTEVKAGGAYTYIECSENTTVSLEIQKQGEVDLKGAGTVVLGLAGEGSSATFDVRGSNPVWIDASYKGLKPPGTYTGSTVLQLSIP